MMQCVSRCFRRGREALNDQTAGVNVAGARKTLRGEAGTADAEGCSTCSTIAASYTTIPLLHLLTTSSTSSATFATSAPTLIPSNTQSIVDLCSPPHSSAIFFAGSSMALTASLNLPISATQSGPWLPQDLVQGSTSATIWEVACSKLSTAVTHFDLSSPEQPAAISLMATPALAASFPTAKRSSMQPSALAIATRASGR